MEITRYVAVDTETTGLDTEKDKPFCITMCNMLGQILFLDTEKDDCSIVRTLFEGEGTPVFHHAKFDIKMLNNIGFPYPHSFEDTMLMSFTVNEQMPCNLEYLSNRLLGEKKYEDPRFLGWIRANRPTVKESGYKEVPREFLIPYAIKDAVNTLKIFFALKGQIEQQDLNLVYHHEKIFLRLLIDIERTGCKIDVPYAIEKASELSCLEDSKKEHLQKEYEIVNPRSHIQVKKAFANNGKVLSSSAKDVLNGLSNNGDQLASDILSFRRTADLLSKSILPTLRRTDIKSHRVHTNFNQTIAKTSRLSSSDPNFQNIPRLDPEKEDSHIARRMFIPEIEHYFIGADYDQMEMRLVAALSEDPALLKFYLEDHEDVYISIAQLIWPNHKIDKRRRYLAKQSALGIAYGMGIQRFVKQAHQYGYDISGIEAEMVIGVFNERFPYVREKRIALSSDIRIKGFVTDVFGRRYRVPKDLNYKAFNNLIQGTAAGIMKRAALKIKDALHAYKARIVNLVHDEVLVEAHKMVDRTKLATVLTNCMKDEDSFSVPITATPIHYSYSWADKVA